MNPILLVVLLFIKCAFSVDISGVYLGSTAFDSAEDIEYDSGKTNNEINLHVVSGDVFIIGYTNGSFQGFTNLGSSDIFVSRFNTETGTKWLTQYGSAAADNGEGIAYDNTIG